MVSRRGLGVALPRPRGRYPGRWVAASLAILVLTLTACTQARTPTPTTPTSTPPPSSPTPTALPVTGTPAATNTPAATDRPAAPETASPAPTEQPATSTPTRATPTEPSDTPTPEAVIHTFEASVDIADPGETITLTWRWSGADTGTIYHLMATGQLSMPTWEVERTGSVTYTIAPERRNYDTFALFLNNEGEGVVAQDTLQIPLRCPDEWFFSPAPDICPAGAAVFTDGAEQHFEDGVMVWNQAEGRIYVLSEEPSREWRAYTDEWEEGDPISDPDIDPPPGLYQPVRGFGLVWREQPHVRERLGWAIHPEQGYETALQHTSHVRYSDLYIRALGGGVWKLGPNGSSWEYIPPEGG